MKYISLLIFSLLFNQDSFTQNYGWYFLINSPGEQLIDIYFTDINTGYTLGSRNVYKTSNSGLNWQLIYTFPVGTGLNSIVFKNDMTGWIGASRPKIYSTTNGGNTWDSISLSCLNFSGIKSFFILDSSNIFGVGREYNNPTFIKSTNGGINWNCSDLSSIFNGLSSCYFFSKDSGIVAGQYGTSGTYARIALTTNGGNVWTIIYNGTRSIESPQQISFPTRNTGYIAIDRTFVQDNYFLKTTNGGISWQELFFVTNQNEQSIGFINENTGWIGGYFNPTFMTTNGGVNWTNANIGNHILKFRILSDTLAFACGVGVYKYGRLIGITKISSEIPSMYKLNQNFPNPFNPVTDIRFELPEYSLVVLNIYDILGRKVTELVNQELKPGIYSVKWNASDYPSGVYYYIMNSGGSTLTKKMVLVR